MDKKNILEEITRASIQLILKEPFYGHFFSTLNKVTTEEVLSMGVAIDANNSLISLYANPHFWKKILNTPEYQMGVLKHEVLHIVFKHILMKDFEYPDLANVAMDIVVNQYIPREHLPGEPVLLENYLEYLDLERDKDARYYYRKLLSVEHQGSGGKQAKKQLERDLQKHRQGSGKNSMGSHQLWGKIKPHLAKAIEASIENTINEAVQRSKKDIGNLPQGLQDYLKKLEELRKPQVNWRRALRQFATTSQRTFLKNTIKKASKRYGTFPGIKLWHRNRLLVAVDTSGSVSDEELNAFFGEMYHIYRQGAEILVVECDAVIQNTYRYRGQMPDFVMGRGGTAFDDPIRYANETYFPDAIIYFTDGYADTPSIIPRAPILWLISEEGIDSDSWDFLPGRKVKMSK